MTTGGFISPVRRLGIVGHAADKFTTATEATAKQRIRELISLYLPHLVVSGGCHLGGVDVWCEEIARDMSVPVLVHRPTVRHWSQPGGYRDRNLSIARDSDLVAVVVVDDYPTGYEGMRFDGCYHCGSRNQKHVKSGGCWTAWRCRRQEWAIITAE